MDTQTGMTHEELKHFVRNHFEEFVNRKNLDIADINFAPEFVDHGADVPPGLPPGPAGAKAYVGGAYKKFPTFTSTSSTSSPKETKSWCATTGPAPRPQPASATNSSEL